MKADFFVSDTGRRGAELTIDGLGDVTIYKKRVTRHDAVAFDEKSTEISKRISAASQKMARAKGEAKKKAADELFDANAEWICHRADGVTPEQLGVIDTSDALEIGAIANKLFEETFEAKKNG